jgi:hypothetical protein
MRRNVPPVSCRVVVFPDVPEPVQAATVPIFDVLSDGTYHEDDLLPS